MLVSVADDHRAREAVRFVVTAEAHTPLVGRSSHADEARRRLAATADP